MTVLETPPQLARDAHRTTVIRSCLDGLYWGSGILAAVSICAVCLLMLAQVAAREVGMQVPGADDLTAWFCAASAFLALAHTFKQGELIRVGLAIEQLGARGRRLAELIALGIGATFCGVMTWWLGVMVFQSWSFGDQAQGVLVIPLWIPQMPTLIGAAILTIAVLDELLLVAVFGREPSYVTAERDRLARGDFSEGI